MVDVFLVWLRFCHSQIRLKDGSQKQLAVGAQTISLAIRFVSQMVDCTKRVRFKYFLARAQ